MITVILLTIAKEHKKSLQEKFTRWILPGWQWGSLVTRWNSSSEFLSNQKNCSQLVFIWHNSSARDTDVIIRGQYWCHACHCHTHYSPLPSWVWASLCPMSVTSWSDITQWSPLATSRVISCPGKQDGTRIAIITLLSYNTNTTSTVIFTGNRILRVGVNIVRMAWRAMAIRECQSIVSTLLPEMALDFWKKISNIRKGTDAKKLASSIFLSHKKVTFHCSFELQTTNSF